MLMLPFCVNRRGSACALIPFLATEDNIPDVKCGKKGYSGENDDQMTMVYYGSPWSYNYDRPCFVKLSTMVQDHD